MKIKLSIVFTFIALLLSVNIANASDSLNDYLITSFNSEIEIEQNTDITVKETIKVDFSETRHGIFREIPTFHYGNGRNIRTNIELISVTDETGKSYIYESTNARNYIKIRIGDPNQTVFGEKVYILTYKAENVLRRYDGVDELYWNALGSNWDTDILSSTVSVKSEYADIEKAACYAGIVGSTSQECEFEIDGNTANFTSNVRFGPGRDFTVVLGLNPENNFIYPSLFTRIIRFVSANTGYAVALAPSLILFYFWYKRGRDKRYISDNVYYKPENANTKTVALFARPHLPLVYHPIDGLSPAEVGTIIDGRVDTHDIIAEIVELARLGFITIEKTEKKRLIGKSSEYTFTKTKKYTDENLDKLKSYQKMILAELFKNHDESVKLSDLKKKFYSSLANIRKDLYEQMEKDGFFASNPDKTRVKWFVIYFILEAIAFMLLIPSIEFNFWPIAMLAVSTIIGVVLAYSMPARTPKGYSLMRQITGLKSYLNTGKWRYEHMERTLFVEEILPLAVSLRVVDKLARDMKDLDIAPPSYFKGTTAAVFANDFNRFYSSSASTLVSTPGSSGSGWSGGSGFSGGSSGGGFGGGGGGSW
jgi:uncharacterized membrane protein YgcG